MRGAWVVLILVGGITAQGATGQQGARGAGEQGARSATGAWGARGATGATGATRARGAAESAQSPKAAARRGIVRGDGHAFVDDGGPFLARGATLFWALWGYQHDRERLGRNLSTLRGWGFDYIRVLGVVGAPGEHPGPVCGPNVSGCDSWRDRRLDPEAASYAQDVAGFTDWAFKEYGLRVQWTIFGGTEFTPTVDARRAVVEKFARMARGREAAIFAFEIANESWQNGFPGEEGKRELHALAKVLKAGSSNLVALSSPENGSCEGAQALYRDSVADLATLHIGRVGTARGENWTALRHVWALHSCTGIPALRSSNEPIGPESSVAGMDDPVALSTMALVTYGSGIGAFVLHTGPGVRGGGEADLVRGRHRNLWELPTVDRIAAGLSNITRLIPGDFANWSTQDELGAAAERLFDVKNRTDVAGVYCFAKNQDFACAPVGIKQPLSLVARRRMTISLHPLLSAAAAASRSLAPGAVLSIPAAHPALLIRGRLN